ncbi:Hypothetical protein, putative [Bodo saltans]|uniref:Mitochondrial import inner membrane translocase subunit TIM50 n=1 Tax=Bodo saltans TaxID=75058 RepID=A0A0S4J698_BODSA|nr:Hypothetical protein, putative [Bodo saltans]|eukprot:CUG85238.1 Hypothetical protein, putative [Bodo saltans]
MRPGSQLNISPHLDKVTFATVASLVLTFSFALGGAIYYLLWKPRQDAAELELAKNAASGGGGAFAPLILQGMRTGTTEKEEAYVDESRSILFEPVAGTALPLQVGEDALPHDLNDEVPARHNCKNCHRHLHWPVPLPPMLHTFGQASNLPQTAKKKHNISTTTKTNHANGKKPLPRMQQAIMTKKKHTLVLDIDETLLNYLESKGHVNHKRLVTYQVYLRPHVGAFLKEMHELFEVVMYTAASSWYGAAMINVLEKAAGLPPSPYYDATVPWGCLDSRDDVPAEEAKAMKYAPVLGKDHVNWYLLTYSHTLNSRRFDSMKHLPILGRDPDSTIIIDDKVRSFPLNPRAGIKICRFGCRDDDDALLQLSPMLRAVAAAPNALRELDHWRPDEYVKCDNFTDNMSGNDVRDRILGNVLYKRRDCAISALVANSGNAELLEEATKLTTQLFEWSKDYMKDEQDKATAFSKY